VAAANALSDVYAMGGTPLFALNLCCFPQTDVPEGVLGEILAGANEKIIEAGAVLLGGHTVRDPELKFGLAVTGEADPERLFTNAAARPGDRLVLTKPLGTGVMINAFKFDKLSEQGLEPVLVEMERLNAAAAAAAARHQARAATDVTGFGLVGHALSMARASGVALRLEFDSLPLYAEFGALARSGITTGCTMGNREHAAGSFALRREMSAHQEELLFDPQTSGGLLIALPEAAARSLVSELRAGGHDAALIGSVLAGEPRVEIH
jgi:selenide,water dikinase